LHLGPPLVLTRGERTSITVVNGLDKPTAVHWHGIELESYFDGVAGFSGQGARIAPVIAPHDSFVARFTPPRAGTFIYHTHVDETVQQVAGLAGPLIVLDPGRTLDTATDHTILITTPPRWEDELRSVLINGRAAPAPITLTSGVPQRLRLINMTTRRPRARVEVWHDSALATWRPLAKDGADLPERVQVAKSARTTLSIGETMDFELVPSAGGEWRIQVRGANYLLLGTLPITVLPAPRAN
jgi:FtsP/CotA-like multicopper oxidase with cupredoxin domain